MINGTGNTAGLFIKARYESTAASLYPHMSQASSSTFMLMIGGLLILNFRKIIGVIGASAIIAALIFLVVAFVKSDLKNLLTFIVL